MYHMAVIWLFWGRDSFCVALRFWLPCHISKKLWTLAILCKFLFSAAFFISESFSVFGVSNCRSAPAKIPLFAAANCLTTTLSWWVWPVVFDCLQPMTSWPRGELASTPTPSGMVENMSRGTLFRSADFECIPSCWPPPAGYIRQPKCTAELHWVRVLIIEIWIDLTCVLGCFMQRLLNEPGSG